MAATKKAAPKKEETQSPAAAPAITPPAEKKPELQPEAKPEPQADPAADGAAASGLPPAPKHASLADAKRGIMIEVGYIKKEKKPGLTYSFLSEEALTEALHHACIRHRITVCPVKVDVVKHGGYTTGKGAYMNHAILAITFRMTHGPSGQSEEGMACGEGADVGDKSVNKASTGAYKYFLRQAFLIPSGDDDPDLYPSESMARAPEPQAQRPRHDAQTHGHDHGQRPAGNGRADAPPQTKPPAQAQQTRPAAQTQQSAGKTQAAAGNDQQAYEKCMDALKGGKSQDTLDRYRDIYRTRGFTPQQTGELDKAYEQRKAELAKLGGKAQAGGD